jgi:hypothetical protein
MIETIVDCYGGKSSWSMNNNSKPMLLGFLSYLSDILIPQEFYPQKTSIQQRISVLAMSVLVLGEIALKYPQVFVGFFETHISKGKLLIFGC